jgi:hypothetical protein
LCFGEGLSCAFDLAPERRRRDPRPRTQQVPDAIHVLSEADDQLGCAERLAGERWDQGVISRTEAYQEEPAPHRQPPDGDSHVL